MKKVNTFIVGAPKCGTTSLANYLSQHPDVSLCNPKEPNFFSDEFQNELINSIEKYHKRFENNKFLIDASTWYLFSNSAARNMYNYNPSAKIIIMLREPSSMIFSLYLQNYFNGTETESFQTALELEDYRKTNKSSPSSKASYKQFLYKETAIFQPQIDRYYELFPRENIKIILFDDFIKNTKEEYYKILSFLGAEIKLPAEGFIVHNPYKSNKNQFLKNAMANPPKIISNILKVFPKQLKYDLGQIIMRLNRKESEKPKISKEIEKDLKTFFAPYNDSLAKAYKLDIHHWNKSA